MKNNDMKNGFRKKGFYIYLMAGAVCVVALAAVCLNTFGQGNNSRQLEINEPSQVAEEEEQTQAPRMSVADNGITGIGSGAAKSGDSVADAKDSEEKLAGTDASKNAGKEKQADENAKGEDSNPGKTDDASEDGKSEDANKADKDDKTGTTDDGEKDGKTEKADGAENAAKDVPVMETGNNISNLKFDQEAGLKWPVNGDVLMKYSADAAIYHKTLGQYKCNPALVISAEEGANVCSAADAVVTKVGKNEEIGKYVVTSIGDDYQITYGQLDKIQVEKGAALKAGEIIGCVGSPTKYYVQEGSNLYMKLKCANDTVDPMIFLE